MRQFITGVFLITTILSVYAQKMAVSKKIKADHVFLRTETPFLLDSIELDLPAEGTLWSKFEGFAEVSYGDVITLATHLAPFWQTDSGNVGTYAQDSTHLQKSFSHSRTWQVEPGKQKVYAMAHNWTDRLGTGYANIAGQLTVVYIPNEGNSNSQGGLANDIYPFKFLIPQRVVQKFDIPQGNEKFICVSYDGFHFGLAGDRIEYQFSTDTIWDAADMHKDLEFTSIYRGRNVSMQACFERPENSTQLYLLGNKTAGNLNTGENAMYSNLVFNDSANDLAHFYKKVGQGDTLIHAFEYASTQKGRLLIRGTASASTPNVGGLILGLGSEGTAMSDTTMVMQSYASNYQQEYFSFTRLVDVVPGINPLNLIANRTGSADSLTLQGEIFYQFIPEAIVSSVKESEGLMQVQLYPNPGSQVLYVDATYTNPDLPMSVFVFDTQGKLILEHANNNSREIHLDVSTLPAGMYHVLVSVNGKLRTFNYIHL